MKVTIVTLILHTSCHFGQSKINNSVLSSNIAYNKTWPRHCGGLHKFAPYCCKTVLVCELVRTFVDTR